MKLKKYIGVVFPAFFLFSMLQCTSESSETPDNDSNQPKTNENQQMVLAIDNYYSNHFKEAIDCLLESDCQEEDKSWWIACSYYKLSEINGIIEKDSREYERSILERLLKMYPEQELIRMCYGLNLLTDEDTETIQNGADQISRIIGKKATDRLAELFKLIFAQENDKNINESEADKTLAFIAKHETLKIFESDLRDLYYLGSYKKIPTDSLSPEVAKISVIIPTKRLENKINEPLDFGFHISVRKWSDYYCYKALEYCRKCGGTRKALALECLIRLRRNELDSLFVVLDKMSMQSSYINCEPFWEEELEAKIKVCNIEALYRLNREKEAFEAWSEFRGISKDYPIAQIVKLANDLKGKFLKPTDNYWAEINDYLLENEARQLAELCEKEYGDFLCPKSLNYIFLSLYYSIWLIEQEANKDITIVVQSLLDKSVINQRDSHSISLNPHSYLLLKAKAEFKRKNFGASMGYYNALVAQYPYLDLTRNLVQIIYSSQHYGSGEVARE